MPVAASDGERSTPARSSAPVGCAMALAQITEIEQRHLPAQAAKLGNFCSPNCPNSNAPAKVQCAARGLGLMRDWN